MAQWQAGYDPGEAAFALARVHRAADPLVDPIVEIRDLGQTVGDRFLLEAAARIPDRSARTG